MIGEQCVAKPLVDGERRPLSARMRDAYSVEETFFHRAAPRAPSGPSLHHSPSPSRQQIFETLCSACHPIEDVT